MQSEHRAGVDFFDSTLGRFAAALVATLLLSGCGGSDGGAAGGKSLNSLQADALRIADPAARARRLLELAQQQQEAGDMFGADDSLAAAVNAAQSVERPADRAKTLNDVACELAKSGDSGGAKKLLREVRKMLESLDDVTLKTSIIAKMAITYGRHLDSASVAASRLSEGEALAATASDPLAHIDALLDIADGYRGIDSNEDTERLIEQSLQIARDLEQPRQRADAFVDIAARLSRMRNKTAAEALRVAGESVAQIENEQSRAHALVRLASALKTAGDSQTARARLDEARTLAEGINDNSLRGPLLERISAARGNL